jgi:hypothetical protein
MRLTQPVLAARWAATRQRPEQNRASLLAGAKAVPHWAHIAGAAAAAAAPQGIQDMRQRWFNPSIAHQSNCSSRTVFTASN